MALLRAKKADIPADAVVITEDEALIYQMKIMKKWKNSSDTFFYRYGTAILASAGGIAGIYINNYYRTKFKLFDHGRIISYLPIVVLPTILSALVHTQIALADVTIQKSCAVCVQLRAAACQSFMGCILPTILAPLSAFPTAMRYGTYDVPYITREPMKVFQIWKKMSVPAGNILFAIFIGQALLASAITYLESNDVRKVTERLVQLEYEMEHN